MKWSIFAIGGLRPSPVRITSHSRMICQRGCALPSWDVCSRYGIERAPIRVSYSLNSTSASDLDWIWNDVRARGRGHHLMGIIRLFMYDYREVGLWCTVSGILVLHFSAGASRLATNYLRQAKSELGDDYISAVLYPYLGFIGLQITEQLDANAFGQISECLRCHTFSGHVLTYPGSPGHSMPQTPGKTMLPLRVCFNQVLQTLWCLR